MKVGNQALQQDWLYFHTFKRVEIKCRAVYQHNLLVSGMLSMTTPQRAFNNMRR
jgi:hypothetical protein